MKDNYLQSAVLAIVGCLMLCHSARCQAQETIRDKEGNTYATKLMPDGMQWMTTDLNTVVDSSWCYANNPDFCKTYGRLYTYAAATKVCETLGAGWHLPSRQEWETLAAQYGGASNNSKDWGKSAFKALQTGGESGFNATLGGNREPGGREFARRNAHGFYWTSTMIDDKTAWNFNFGAGGKALHCQNGIGIGDATSVRCVRAAP